MGELMRLLVDLHIEGERQGPGCDEATRLAIRLAGLEAASGLRIADIGCGTGASTLVLASDLDAHITAVDFPSCDSARPRNRPIAARGVAAEAVYVGGPGRMQSARFLRG